VHAPIKSPRPFCGSALRRACLPALLLAAVLTYFFQVQPFRPADPLTESFLLETAIQSSRAGVARLYYDHGDGFRRPDSTVVKIEPGAQVARFLVPPNRYQGFRFDPLDLPGDVVIRPQRIVTTEGRVMQDFIDLIREQLVNPTNVARQSAAGRLQVASFRRNPTEPNPQRIDRRICIQKTLQRLNCRRRTRTRSFLQDRIQQSCCGCPDFNRRRLVNQDHMPLLNIKLLFGQE